MYQNTSPRFKHKTAPRLSSIYLNNVNKQKKTQTNKGIKQNITATLPEIMIIHTSRVSYDSYTKQSDTLCNLCTCER